MFGSRREKNYLEDGDGGWRMEGGDGKAGKFYEENFSLPDSPRLEMMVVIMVEMMVEMMVLSMMVVMMVVMMLVIMVEMMVVSVMLVLMVEMMAGFGPVMMMTRLSTFSS